MGGRVDRRLAGAVFSGLGAGAAIVGLIIGPLHAGMTALATMWTAAATAPRVDAMLWPLLALAERQAEAYARRRKRRIGV